MRKKEQDNEAPIRLVNHVNNILQSIFSNVEMYIKNQLNDNSIGLCALKSYICNNCKGAFSENKKDLHFEGYDYGEFPVKSVEFPLPEPFFTRRMKMLSRNDGFILYCKMGVEFFCTSVLLYTKMKNRLRLIRARPYFIQLATNTTLFLELLIVDFTIVVLDDFYHLFFGMIFTKNN